MRLPDIVTHSTSIVKLFFNKGLIFAGLLFIIALATCTKKVNNWAQKNWEGQRTTQKSPRSRFALTRIPPKCWRNAVRYLAFQGRRSSGKVFAGCTKVFPNKKRKRPHPIKEKAASPIAQMPERARVHKYCTLCLSSFQAFVRKNLKG